MTEEGNVNIVHPPNTVGHTKEGLYLRNSEMLNWKFLPTINNKDENKSKNQMGKIVKELILYVLFLS